MRLNMHRADFIFTSTSTSQRWSALYSQPSKAHSPHSEFTINLARTFTYFGKQGVYTSAIGQTDCAATPCTSYQSTQPYAGLPRNGVDYYVVMMGNDESNKEKITQYKIKQCRWRKSRWESKEIGTRNSVTNKMMSGEDNRSRRRNSSITRRHTRWRLENYLGCHSATLVRGKLNNR